MKKITIRDISSFLIAFSMLLYALRGNYGAIAISCLIMIEIVVLLTKKNGKRIPKGNSYAAAFLIVFAFFFQMTRTISFEYYRIIGYLATALLLFDAKPGQYNSLWKWLKAISIFEAIGVFVQLLIPNIYYFIMSFLVSDEMLSSIRERLLTGYYTGFTHEVSYTMFLIVIGLGIYIYQSDLKRNKRSLVPIIFLSLALVVSGKRATLVFFIAAFFLVQFIKSDSKVKILKYTAVVLGVIAIIWITYPYWSKLQAFSRINTFIAFFQVRDYTAMFSGRSMIYEDAVKLWQTNPWFGIGWGNFKYSVASTAWYARFDVHNCYLQILCETGIVGAALFLGIIVTSVVNSIKAVFIFRRNMDVNNYRLSLFCCFIQIFFLLYSLTEPILYEYTDYVIFMICFSCSNILVGSRQTDISALRGVRTIGVANGKVIS